MDRVPRFFKRGGKSSDRDKELPRPEMDPTRTRRRPRLDRRNAAKDIDYEAASTSSFPDEAVTETSPSYSLVTRSLDLIGDRTSFRIEGTEEGEFDRVCRSLGLTGIDDFAIPAAAWEAMKVRSASDLLPRSRASGLGESPKEAEAGESPKEAEAGESPKEAEAEGMKVESGGIRIRVLGGEVEEEVGSTECSRGINGVRPPLLKPPPVMTLPAAVYTGSTWDLMRDLAPETDRGLVVTRGFDSDNEEADGREVVEDRTDRRVLSESYSFTTSNDDDASSSTTDPTNLSPNIRDPREIRGVWEKGKLLGSGSFGTVYEGIDEGGYFFAVKEVSLLDQGSQGRQSIVQLKQEIALLSQFKHDNIVQYLGSETDDSKLYIFLELVSQGSLMSLYNRYHLRDSQVSAYTRQILNGLKYLHEQNVVHRDIKCANILVDTNGNVKLADFGLAKATKLNDVKSSKGTACWMAPEVVNRKNQGYGLPADIWSLGCTVLEMLTSQIPYSELDSFQAIYRIGKGIPPSVPESLSTDARDFILQCLKVDPSDRPTAAQLLDHPFVKRPLYILSGSASPYIGRRSRDFTPPQL